MTKFSQADKDKSKKKDIRLLCYSKKVLSRQNIKYGKLSMKVSNKDKW